MPRPYERTQFQPSFGRESGYRLDDGVYSNVYSNEWSLSGVDSRNRSWSGVSTPGFKNLVRSRKKRALPENSHSVSKLINHAASRYRSIVRADYMRLYWDSSLPGGGGYVPGYSSTVVFDEDDSFAHKFNYVPTPVHSSRVEQKAIAKLQKKLRGPSANLALAFAERGQTARLMSDTVWRIARAARALKRGRLGDVYHELGMSKGLSVRQERRIVSTPPDKRLANHWLELQYGWRPLLSDVHDAAELLAHHIETDPYHESVRARATEAVTWVDYDRNDFFERFGNRIQISSGSEIHTTECRYNLKVRLDSISRSILAQTGIANPLLLGWELVPFSFVVDWFLPVGNYLESLSAYNGWELVSGTKTLFTRMEFQRRMLSDPGYSYSSPLGEYTRWSREVMGEKSVSAIKLDRTVVSSFPTLDFPSIKPISEALSPTHFANGLALLTTLFRGK